MCKVLLVVAYLIFQSILTKAQNKHLMYFDVPATWLQANKQCSECGGRLVDWDESVSKILFNNNLQNKIIWIGNYTVKNPWIVEKGCASPKGLKYNIIYHNTPEFCSRTCSGNQMFALQGEFCYCVDTWRLQWSFECDRNSKACHKFCFDGDIKVYGIDDVYACNFEKSDNCVNTNYGEETNGLVWKRTKDYGDVRIDNIGAEKGHYLLLQYPENTAKNKALFSILLSLPDLYFCMSFSYYMNYGGSLEIFVSSDNVKKYVAWKKYGSKGHMWYSSSLDIKGQKTLKIEIYGSLEDSNMEARLSKVAIDDINIKPGACNKEKWLDCNFDKTLCEWKQRSELELMKQDKKGNNILRNKLKDGHFFLNSSDLFPFISDEFCLRFQYYIDKWETFSLTALVDKYKILNFETSAIAKWITVSQTFQSGNHSNVIFIWSAEQTFIGFDNVSARSGSCEQEKIINFVVEENDLHGWYIDSALDVQFKAVKGTENSFDIKSYKGHNTKGNTYQIKSPIIPITSSEIFCFKFLYWSIHSDALKIRIINSSTDTHVWDEIVSDLYMNTENLFDFQATDNYQVVLEFVKKTNRQQSWIIADLMLTSGLCKRGSNKNTDDATMGPMCPVINISDNSRLSVGYCPKMKKQAYICQFEGNEQFTREGFLCKSGKVLNEGNVVITTEGSTLQTTESYQTTDLHHTSEYISGRGTIHVTSSQTSGIPQTTTKEITNSFALTNKIVGVMTSPNHPYSNASKLSTLEQRNGKTEIALVSGILSAIVVGLLILVLWLFLKLKRNQTTCKGEKSQCISSVQNFGYEMESINSSDIQMEKRTKGDSDDYELASHGKFESDKNGDQHVYNNDTAKYNHETTYQNNNILTFPQKHESQVYQAMDEGAYDHLGGSADRRCDSNNGDNATYDHAQKVKQQIDDTYDTTTMKTDDNYFILEPENSASYESVIYDHTD